MTSAREEILARVRRADASATVVVPRDYRPAGTVPLDVEMFVDRLVDYKATVHRCTESEIVPTIAECLVDARSVVRPPGLPIPWLDGLTVREEPLTVIELDAIDAVVTTCAVAIADTGTIVLDHGEGQGRRALTLVPDHHVVVVRVDQVVASVPDAVATLQAGTVLTWISGPSATSDIELSRVEGVHGPRRLDVIIVG